MQWVNAAIQGILVGGLYALFATGLSLAFGVMRFVNLAHGDLAVLGAYFVVSWVGAFGGNYWLTMVAVVALLAGEQRDSSASVFQLLGLTGMFVTLFVVSALLFRHAARQQLLEKAVA